MPGHREDRTRWWWSGWWAIWLVLVGVELAVAGGGYLNHDVAWFCYMSQRWGDGARLYVDVVDTNPPLIVFLSTPPILLAKALSWPVDVTMLAYVSALAIASVAVCGMLVVRAWPDADPLQRGLFMTGIVAVVFPLSGTDFAQREHLALIFALPYVLAAAVRLSGLALPWPAAMAIGFMGGLGLAIKPHLLAIAVIVEGTMVALRGARQMMRPEVLGMTLALGVYGSLVLVAFSAYVAIARSAAEVYHGWNSSPAELFSSPALALWTLSVLATIAARHSAPTIVYSLAAAATGALAGGLAQLKGWSYHMYPALAFSWLVAFALAATLVRRDVVAGSRGRLVRVAVVGALVVGFTAWGGHGVVREQRRTASDGLGKLLAIAREHPFPRPVFVLGLTLQPGVPFLMYSNRPWAGRHNSLWFLPGLYADQLRVAAPEVKWRRPGAMSPLERRLFDEIVDDLCAQAPGVLIVQTAPHRGRAGHKVVDLIAYYRQHERFATLIDGYRTEATVGAFTVLVPRATPTCSAHTAAQEPAGGTTGSRT